MDAAIAGLVGAGLGLVGSLGAVWIQNHYLTKRERAKSVMEIAVRSREQEVSLVAAGARRRNILPIEVYVQHHQAIFDLLEKGDFNTKAVVKIFAERDSLARRLDVLADEWAVADAIEKAGG